MRRVRIKDVMLLTSWYLEVLWLPFRQAFPNGIESIDVVSSRSNSPDPIAVTKSLIDIAVVLHTIALVEVNVSRRGGELDGDGCLTFNTRRPRDCRFQLFLYAVRRSSLFTDSGSSVLRLFP